jgi:hypothetical protein
MKEVATVRFLDAESGDEAWVIVRASDKIVGVAFTLKSNGDFEVFLERDDCRSLIAELQRALTISETAK